MKRKKGKNRVKISFAATILVLSSITVIVYALSFRVPSYSIPANLPPYGGLIGKYAPSDSLQVSFQNYSAIRAINASAVPNNQLVNLVNPSITVHVSAVQQQVLVTLLNPALHINNTATAAVLDTGAFTNLSRALTNSNLVPDMEQNFALYQVNDSSNGRTKTEWLTLVPGGSSVVFAEGALDAKATILRVLSVWDGATPSILTSQNVTRMLYPVGGTNHLAFTVENFTGEVLSSKMGVVTLDVTNQRIQLTHVVRFASSSLASAQVGQVQGVYRFANDFSIWEENVEAVQSYSLSNLQGAVVLAGG